MATIPFSNARSSLEVQTENVHRCDFPTFRWAYVVGRMIMISITIYLLIGDLLDELKYPHHWLGFLTIHMILECSVTYSDPLWNLECIKIVKIHIHCVFAVAALVLGTAYSSFWKITLFSVSYYNSTGIVTSVNGIEPKGPSHCSYSYSLLSFIWAIGFLSIFVTGIVLFANVRLLGTHMYRFHKCGGTLVTYSMILLLACSILTWLSAPINWIILLVTILAFVLMPIKIFANRVVSNQ